MKQFYVLEVPGAILGIFNKKGIEEQLKYHLDEDDHFTVSIYELNVSYDMDFSSPYYDFPEYINAKNWLHELQKEDQ